jgi:hypothetical protein
MNSRAILGLGAAMSIVMLAAPAFADFPRTYVQDGTNCHPDSISDTGVAPDETGHLKSNEMGERYVVCAVNKYTSGPYISSGDAIKTIQMNIHNGGATPVSCKLRVYWNALQGSQNNLWETFSPSTQTSSSITIQANAVEGYWWDRAYWLFPVLECTLHKDDWIGSYTVTEAGTFQASHIMSISRCTQLGTKQFNYYPSLAANPGGYYENPGGGSSDFKYSCPTGGTSAQFALTPSINPSGFGWSPFIDGPFPAGAGSYQVGLEFYTILLGGNNLYPWLTLPPSQAVWNGVNDNWVNTGMTWNYFFKDLNTEGHGDMKMVSYRTLGDNQL